MLSEIEQKVLSLLEDGGKSAGHQQEAEDLSLKLKEMKCNLEKVQMMLQDKYSEEQVKHMNSVLRKSESSAVAEEQLKLTVCNKEGRRVDQKCQTCYFFPVCTAVWLSFICSK